MGTPSVVLAVAHPWASASSYLSLSSQFLADSRCNRAHSAQHLEHLECSHQPQKERKKIDNPREGWEESSTSHPGPDVIKMLLALVDSIRICGAPGPAHLRSLATAVRTSCRLEPLRR